MFSYLNVEKAVTMSKNLLSSFNLFSILPPETLDLMIKSFEKETYKKGEKPFNSSTTQVRFNLILSGKLKVYKTNPDTIREYSIFILGENDYFDIFTLLDTNKHEVETIVLEKIEVLSVDIHLMRYWVNYYSKLNTQLLPYLGKRMLMLETAACDIVLTNTTSRLAKLILNTLNDKTYPINLLNNLSHKDIAHLIGTTRNVVSRQLKELKKIGAITTERKKIKVEELTLLKKELIDTGI